MASFDEAFKIVLAHEGGYENDPDDIGGETKYGISKRAYPNIDIKSLTLDQAKEIYRKDYWNSLNGDNIINQAIANKLFDISVNIGIKWAIKCMQRACRSATGTILDVDGILGDKTFDVVNHVAKPDVLLAAYKSEVAGYYRSLNSPKYSNGWLNRAYS